MPFEKQWFRSSVREGNVTDCHAKEELRMSFQILWTAPHLHVPILQRYGYSSPKCLGILNFYSLKSTIIGKIKRKKFTSFCGSSFFARWKVRLNVRTTPFLSTIVFFRRGCHWCHIRLENRHPSPLYSNPCKMYTFDRPGARPGNIGVQSPRISITSRELRDGTIHELCTP